MLQTLLNVVAATRLFPFHPPMGTPIKRQNEKTEKGKSPICFPLEDSPITIRT